VRFDMKWVRSNIRRVSHVALFALVIQFALSFGHVHAIAAQATPAAIAQTAQSLPAPQPLSDHGSGEHPGDICAICVVMAMASTAMFAMPPVVLLPYAAEFSYMVAAAEFVRVAHLRVAFQPRAPPVS
jgi:hypothetical protein